MNEAVSAIAIAQGIKQLLNLPVNQERFRHACGRDQSMILGIVQECDEIIRMNRRR